MKNKSKFGFGTYRIENIEEHKETLYKALEKGVNVIDTSSNYSHGDSERCIGDVVSDLIRQEKVERTDLTIISKAGYIQGDLLHEITSKNIDEDKIVNCEAHLKHCIEPDFLEDQLSASLDRLKMDYLDCFLLHNPEYYLQYSKKSSEDEDLLYAEYYDRIEKAFHYCETEVKKGRIKSYGISSNTFSLNQDSIDSTSLKKVCEIADRIQSNHHFKVIQCPFNLIENTLITSNFFEFAKEKDLFTCINRPLNAIHNSKLLRLSELEETIEVTYIEIEDLMEQGIQLEESIKEKLTEKEAKAVFIEYLNFCSVLKRSYQSELSYFSFKDFLKYSIYPAVEQYLSLFQEDQIDDEIQENLQEYMTHFNELIKSILGFSSNRHNEYVRDIKAAICKNLNPELFDIGLSRLLLSIYTSTSNIDCILLGMRQDRYVQEAVEVMKEPELKLNTQFWRNTQETLKF